MYLSTVRLSEMIRSLVYLLTEVSVYSHLLAKSTGAFKHVVGTKQSTSAFEQSTSSFKQSTNVFKLIVVIKHVVVTKESTSVFTAAFNFYKCPSSHRRQCEKTLQCSRRQRHFALVCATKKLRMDSNSKRKRCMGNQSSHQKEIRRMAKSLTS